MDTKMYQDPRMANQLAALFQRGSGQQYQGPVSGQPLQEGAPRPGFAAFLGNLSQHSKMTDEAINAAKQSSAPRNWASDQPVPVGSGLPDWAQSPGYGPGFPARPSPGYGQPMPVGPGYGSGQPMLKPRPMPAGFAQAPSGTPEQLAGRQDWRDTSRDPMPYTGWAKPQPGGPARPKRQRGPRNWR